MITQPDLYTIRIACLPQQADAIETAFADEALAVSTFAPPRTGKAVVEILVDGAPGKAQIETKVALILAASMRDAPPLRYCERSEAIQSRKSPIQISCNSGLLRREDAPRNDDIEIAIAPVGNLDWIKKVAEDFPPLPIARWTVFGAAHRDKIKNPRLALQIDATSAFGTGEHPTTRGCLLLLHALLKKNPAAHHWRMLDMGCGSGILAMAFAKAAHGRALGVDMDPPSVKIAQGNLRDNGIRRLVRFEVGTGYRLPLIGQEAPYDLIMANIFAGPLCKMAKDLKRHLKPGGVAILSGILNTQVNAVLSAHRKQGLFLHKRMCLGEWSVLALGRPIKAS